MKTKLTSYDLPKLQIPTPEVHRIGLKVKRKEGESLSLKKQVVNFIQTAARALEPLILFFQDGTN